MRRHIRRWTLGIMAAAALATGGGALNADAPVKIQVSGHYFAEPATVDVLIAVERNSENRTLRVEADGESFYRSSELSLEGDGDRKYHTILLKNIPAGDYVLRAVLLNGRRELATAETQLLVMSQ